jgi:hypothetical protein
MYVAMCNFHSFFVFMKKSWMALMICIFPILVTPPTYCNICLMELICVNDSNVATCNLFKLYIYIYIWIFELKWVIIYCHK